MTAVPREYAPPPPKPKRMSEKKYRELHDTEPTIVTVVGVAVFRCCGPVTAEVIANTYRADGRTVQIRYAD